MSQPSVLLVGTGNIAHAHAQAIKALGSARMAAVVDTNADAARRFAQQYGIPTVHGDVDAALADASVDLVHVLTPPDSHAPLVQKAAQAGKAVFAEKPVCTGAAQAVMLEGLAPTRPVAVNQNFCFHPAFAPVREAMRTGEYGRLRYLNVTFHPALRQLAARQFTHWMFASPLNLLLEQAVHPLSQVLALTGRIDDIVVQSGKPVALSGGAGFVPEMMCAIQAGDVRVGFHFMVGANFPQWRLVADFDDGTITADMITNTVQRMGRTRYLEPLDHALSVARSGAGVAVNGVGNLAVYGMSQLGLRGRSDPFFVSMRESVAHVHGALKGAHPLLTDLRFGLDLVDACTRIAEQLPKPVATTKAPAVAEALLSAGRAANRDGEPIAMALEQPMVGDAPPVSRPTGDVVLVIGGTGFIGKPTVRRLIEAGYRVRVMARGIRNLPDIFTHPAVEIVRGDVKSADDIDRATAGARYVVNLAHGGGGATYAEIRAAMVDSAVAVASAAVRHGVRRVVHVGSIAGLYLGDPSEVITGATPPDPQPEKRGDYGRAKAEADHAFIQTCKAGNLDWVILRPGVVVGEGTAPLHSGLGTFNNDQHVIGWNAGRNPLPFVLADDVAAAIVPSLNAPAAPGRCYNLAGDVSMSAREYMDELARAVGRPLKFHGSSARGLWAVEVGKWAIKRVGGRKVPMPSIRDLASRGMPARFDCGDAKRDLGWQPVADRNDFVRQAIAIHA